jgi:hypothetical protein
VDWPGDDGALASIIMRLSVLSAVLCLAACGSTPEITSVTANPTTVAAGGTTTLTVVIVGTDLGEHGEAAATARGLRAADSGAVEMHLHTYLDNTDSNPLVQTASTTFPVFIPVGTAGGAHSLIVRLHNGDHTIYDPEVKSTVAVTVQ